MKIKGIICSFITIATLNIFFISCKNTHQKDISSILIYDYLPDKYIGSNVIVIFNDMNSIIVRENTNKIINYANNSILKIIPVLVLKNNQIDSGYSDCLLIDQKIMDELRLNNNYYYVFNSQGKYLLSNYLTNNIKAMLSELDRAFEIPNEYANEMIIGNNINSTSVAFISKGIKVDSEMTLFAMFADICIGCKSGEVLLRMNEAYISSKKKIHCVFVVMNDYSNSEIESYKNNKDIKIDILLPEEKTLLRWRDIENILNREHPWRELFVLVDSSGKILKVTRNVIDALKIIE